MDLDATLANLAADPCTPVDLAEVTLHLAADEYPALCPAEYLARLDTHADELAPRLTGRLANDVAALTTYLFDECEYRGNTTDYYDPRNSYLNDVLDRKLGLPITLSILAASVGDRCGLSVYGVGLPGHFVAAATDGEQAVLFDPFHGGRTLDRAGAAALASAVAGHPVSVTTAMLQPTPPGLIVQRVLSNLRNVYLRAADFRRAARVFGRLTQLCPNEPTLRRDLGTCLVQAGRPGAALPHLTAYLDSNPAADDADTVRAILREARAEVARWN